MTSFSLTSLHLALVDCGPETPGANAALVGATLFGCSTGLHSVGFELRSALLDSSDPPHFMRDWIDDRLLDRGPVIAGYDLGRAVHAYDRERQPVLSKRTARILTSQTMRPVVDLRIVSDEPHLDFVDACDASGIPTDRRSPLDRLDDWIVGRRTRTLLGMQIDAIATWRLALAVLGFQSMSGECLRDGMSISLARWLRETGVPAGIPHLAGGATPEEGSVPRGEGRI